MSSPTLGKRFVSLTTARQLKELTQQSNGEAITIKSIDIFSFFESHITADMDILFTVEAFSFVARESAKRKFHCEPTQGAVNNCQGRWFELLFLREFARCCNDHNLIEERKVDVCKLPSANAEAEFFELFIPAQRDELSKIKPSTSNPDFLIMHNLDNPIIHSQSTVLERYSTRDYYGKIDMHNINAVISIKTSARPDRRYQQLYEANLVKILGLRFDIKLKFITVSLYKNERNDAVYSSPSIISIFRDKDHFEPAIDESIAINSNADIQKLFQRLLGHH